MQNHSRSVAELRRESERTRAELTQTVDTLRSQITETAADIRQKVSPEHIKAEVSDYVAEKGRNWFDGLKQQAMDNPMQALAAGTAIALPALKLVRSVPLPLLMIGAGLALTSPRVRSAMAEKVSETLKTSDGVSVIDKTTEMARENWQTARARTEDAIGEASRTVSARAAEVRDAASEMAGEVRQRAADVTGVARQKVEAAAGTVSSTVSSTVNAASEAAKDALDTTRTKVSETLTATRQSAETVVRDNAALVGGLGLAIGALIAAALPSTRAERATLGTAGDALRKTAADTVAEKFEEAKTAAMSAAESVAEKIAGAGLGPTVNKTTENAVGKLKDVADDTITTAFEPSHANHR